MVNLTALNSLPQDQLNLAYLYEARELNRYRSLVLSFLPFDPPVSRLMSAIGLECEQRLCNLQEVARWMALSPLPNVSQLKETPFVTKNCRHFFVVDENMGRQVLESAEKGAEATCTFFSWLLETNATPELHQPLSSFVAQKISEYRVLQECREQWKIGLAELCFTS